MKKIVLFCITCCIAGLVKAQHYPVWSIETGMGISGHMGTDKSAGSARFSQKISFNVDVPMNEFLSLQTGIGFVNKGAREMYDTNFKANQAYLQVPFLAALHFGTPIGVDVVVNGGPYFALGIGGQYTYKGEDFVQQGSVFKNTPNAMGFSGYRRYDAGIQLGIKADVEHWYVGTTFECGVVPISAGNTVNNYGLYITAGYKF